MFIHFSNEFYLINGFIKIINKKIKIKLNYVTIYVNSFDQWIFLSNGFIIIYLIVNSLLIPLNKMLIHWPNLFYFTNGVIEI